MNYLDFEKPLAEIDGKAAELRSWARTNPQMEVGREAEALDKKPAALCEDMGVETDEAAGVNVRDFAVA
jgi:acetyl-CoA carboxylase carboxyl transferase subunit alpha